MKEKKNPLWLRLFAELLTFLTFVWLYVAPPSGGSGWNFAVSAVAFIAMLFILAGTAIGFARGFWLGLLEFFYRK